MAAPKPLLTYGTPLSLIPAPFIHLHLSGSRAKKLSKTTSTCNHQAQELSDATHHTFQLQSYLDDTQNFELISLGLASNPVDMSAQMDEWQNKWDSAQSGGSDQT